MTLTAYRAYPWQGLKADTTICDIGGNSGHAPLDLVKASPHLKVIVQDLPLIEPKFEEVRPRRECSASFDLTCGL